MLVLELESAMQKYAFLSNNPVFVALQNNAMTKEGLAEVLRQYCRLPEEIVSILRATARQFPTGSGIRRELNRNIGQERGSATGKVPHVDILKFALGRDLKVDVEDMGASPCTDDFLAFLAKGAQRERNFALGVVHALEATAVPELSLLVGPAINAYATMDGLTKPIDQEALGEEGSYPLPTIRSESEAMTMTMSAWMALHTKDFEVSHRDNLRAEAEAFLQTSGDFTQFRAGFIATLEAMDAWWSGLATGH